MLAPMPLLNLWTVLWGDAPLWVSIPVTLAIVAGLFVLWQKAERGDFDSNRRY